MSEKYGTTVAIFNCMAAFNDASDISEPLGMHLLLSKMHDASDECQFVSLVGMLEELE